MNRSLLDSPSLRENRENAELKLARLELEQQMKILVDFHSWAGSLAIRDAAKLVADKAQRLHEVETIRRERQLEAEFLNREASRQMLLAVS